MSATTYTELTLANKKLHCFAIYVIQQLQEQFHVNADFDALSLNIDYTKSFDMKSIQAKLKVDKKKTTKKVKAVKDDVVDAIVNQFYDGELNINDADVPVRGKCSEKAPKKKAPASEESEEADASPKKRGKVAKVSDVPASNDASKDEVEAEAPKKRAGRPKKANVVAEIKDVIDVPIVDNIPVVPAVVVEEAPKKRGGRPKKVKEPVVEGEAVIEEAPKKRGGRPKKVKEPEMVGVEGNVLNEVEAENIVDKIVKASKPEKKTAAAKKETKKSVVEVNDTEDKVKFINDDDEHAMGRIAVYKGVEYTIDEEMNVYNEWLEHVGTFNAEKNVIDMFEK